MGLIVYVISSPGGAGSAAGGETKEGGRRLPQSRTPYARAGARAFLAAFPSTARACSARAMSVVGRWARYYYPPSTFMAAVFGSP